jgi:hypothetical protein
MILQVTRNIWRTRTALSMRIPRVSFARLRDLASQVAPRRSFETPIDQNSFKKFSQIGVDAQKIDSLPPKHTFLRAKK